MCAGTDKAQDLALVAKAANDIARWCGLRDLCELSCAALHNEMGLEDGVADVFVLFGGGVVGSVEVLAAAMRASVARRYAIVGGRGHATYWLDQAYERELSDAADKTIRGVRPGESSEAEMLDALLAIRHGMHADFLETHSTNCGNNVSYLMDLLEEKDRVPHSVILCQDATMQRRMDATWRKQVHDRRAFADTTVVNWASYEAELGADGEALVWERAPEGMWRPERYLELLVGEVDRLTDDEGGYGPRGADFVVHLDVPSKVRAAATILRPFLVSGGRAADERYRGSERE